jgi:hypothetical protein
MERSDLVSFVREALGHAVGGGAPLSMSIQTSAM